MSGTQHGLGQSPLTGSHPRDVDIRFVEAFLEENSHPLSRLETRTERDNQYTEELEATVGGCAVRLVTSAPLGASKLAGPTCSDCLSTA